MFSQSEIQKMKKEKRSVLLPHLAAIKELRQHGVPYRAIVEWLQTVDVKTSSENLRKFCLRNGLNSGMSSVKTSETEKNKKISFLTEE